MRTYQKRCRRCAGRGTFFDRGDCFNCRGRGEITVYVYTPEEKAAARELWQRSTDALATLRAFADAELKVQAGWDMALAFGHLRDNDAERFAKLLASVESGSVRAVALALLSYYIDTVCKGENQS